ncbi:DUF3426 domain-containing protein [Bordetella bronchialis]|uniref:Zinc finger/thioredoxin putative domain-containing protein n=1 Tax=Bordetella bronchialis TaxID=463025 RepID=A0ABN4R7L1_9BORD|nr:hypothetical protein BAU06_22625 [Bordetella bronchialis]
MAMTTRCPHCGTAFKVVADQLRVRNGLVRCGACSRVFDGQACIVGGQGAATPARPTPASAPAPAVRPTPGAHTESASAQGAVPAQASPVLSVRAPQEPPAYHPPSYPAQQEPPAYHPPSYPAPQESPYYPAPPRQAASHPAPSYPPAPDTASIDTASPDTAASGNAPAGSASWHAAPSRAAVPPSRTVPAGVTPEPAVLRGREDTRRAIPEQHGPVFGPATTPRRKDVEDFDEDDAAGYREPYAPYRQDDLEDAEQQARDMALPRDDRFPIYADRDLVDEDEPAFVAVPGEARTRYDDLTDAGMAPPIFMDEEVQRRRSLFARLWVAGCLVGLVALALQCVYIYRTSIATAVPALRPVLEGACAPLGCQVGYTRRLERISITASSLQPQSGVAQEDGVMRLTLRVTLRNRYDKPQPWPALVLQLTDLSDTVVVRKVLLPENYLPPGTRGPFQAGAEQTLAVPLTVNGLHVNGYQLDKFFP